MQTLTVLTPADARDGFRLAGARQRVLTPEELAAALQELLREREPGLLVIDERLQGDFSGRRLRELAKTWPGLLMTLPAPRSESHAEDEFERLVRRALGYHVRLRP